MHINLWRLHEIFDSHDIFFNYISPRGRIFVGFLNEFFLFNCVFYSTLRKTKSICFGGLKNYEHVSPTNN